MRKLILYIFWLKKWFSNNKNWFLEIYFTSIRCKKIYLPSKHKPHLVAINVYAVKIVAADPGVALGKITYFPLYYARKYAHLDLREYSRK